MFERLQRYFDRKSHKRGLKFWQAKAQTAHELSLYELRSLRNTVRQLQTRLKRIGYIADERLTLPVIGSNAMRNPSRTLWSHRPSLWLGPITPSGFAGVRTKTEIADDVTMFHDCAHSEITIRQMRNTEEKDFAPFGMKMDVFSFDGSFMSLAVSLPSEALNGLKQDHVVRVNLEIESENPIEIFVRLNLKHGPNIEQIVREMDFKANETFVEFDLQEKSFNESRLDGMWVDIIFGSPSMNQVTLRDMTVLRRQHASV